MSLSLYDTTPDDRHKDHLHTQIRVFEHQKAAEEYLESLTPTASVVISEPRATHIGIVEATGHLDNLIDMKMHGGRQSRVSNALVKRVGSEDTTEVEQTVALSAFVDSNEVSELEPTLAALSVIEHEHLQINYVTRKDDRCMETNRCRQTLLLAVSKKRLHINKVVVPVTEWRFARCWNCQSTINLYVCGKAAQEGVCPICKYEGITFASLEAALTRGSVSPSVQTVARRYLKFIKRRLKCDPNLPVPKKLDPFLSRPLCFSNREVALHKARTLFLRAVLRRGQHPSAPKRKWLVYSKYLTRRRSAAETE